VEIEDGGDLFDSLLAQDRGTRLSDDEINDFNHHHTCLLIFTSQPLHTNTDRHATGTHRQREHREREHRESTERAQREGVEREHRESTERE
jgi:hypothetical protein